jgi:hypothetical protein
MFKPLLVLMKPVTARVNAKPRFATAAVLKGYLLSLCQTSSDRSR